jgi:hypothetical protein
MKYLRPVEFVAISALRFHPDPSVDEIISKPPFSPAYSLDISFFHCSSIASLGATMKWKDTSSGNSRSARSAVKVFPEPVAISNIPTNPLSFQYSIARS